MSLKLSEKLAYQVRRISCFVSLNSVIAFRDMLFNLILKHPHLLPVSDYLVSLAFIFLFVC